MEENNQRAFLCQRCLGACSEAEWIVETEGVFLSPFTNVDLCIRAPALEISAVSTKVMDIVIKCWFYKLRVIFNVMAPELGLFH